MNVKFKLLNGDARLPQRATPGSGAFDLYAPHGGKIRPGKRQQIFLGIAHEVVEEGLHGFLISRSGLAKRGVRLFFSPGLIDHDYRGEISIILENLSDDVFTYQAGDRLCQIAYMRCFMGPAVEASELSETQRGTGGFGSTGA